MNRVADVLADQSSHKCIGRSGYMGRRDGYRCVGQMVPLDVTHRCRLASRDGAEVIQMLADPAPTEPLWKFGRRDFEQVLVQSAWAVSPENQL